ncbi:MAG: hypothetical protein Q7R93_03660 [bacterium]|nr:hypothetical protein [bacterium]
MSEQIPKHNLDIGGGVGDFDMEHRRKDKEAGHMSDDDWEVALKRAKGYVENLRAVKLAKEHPDQEFFVLDTHAPREACLEVTKDVPNVRFAVAEVELKDSIPYPAEHFDSIEMNFVFTPLTANESWVEDGPRLQHREVLIRVPEDAPLYAHTLAEAARVLKKGSRLVICEKQQRINRILGLLSTEKNDRELKHGSEFLQSIGLRFVSLSEMTDSTYSMYGWGALNQVKDLELAEKKEYADNMRPFRLELEKI